MNKLEDLALLFPIINGKVSTAINRMMLYNLEKRGLPIEPEQWTILAFLWIEDGVTQQVLCDYTFKDKPSMTRLIDKLVKQKLVIRKISPTDRRSNQIFLTPLGKGIEVKTKEAILETMQTSLKGIDAEGIERLKNVLTLVFTNISNELENENKITILK